MPYKDPSKHREACYARTKRWRAKNAERHREVKRAWNIANRDRINEQRRFRYAIDTEHRDKIDLRNRARRWDIPENELEAFMALYDEECFYCGNEGGSIDHLVPVAQGGVDRLYNLVPCCKSCNSSKNNRTPGEWYDGSPIRRSETAG